MNTTKPAGARPLVLRLRKSFRDHVFDVDDILLFSKPLDRPSKHRRLEPKGTTVHIATTEAELAPMIASFPERARYFREYIADGRTAFFALKSGAVVGYLFVTTRDFFDHHLCRNTIKVGEGQIFLFAGFVSPDSRGSIASLLLLQRVHEHYKDKGFTTVLATVSSRNKRSWSVCLKLGYDQMDQAWEVFKLFRLRWSRPSSVRQWVELGRSGS